MDEGKARQVENALGERRGSADPQRNASSSREASPEFEYSLQSALEVLKVWMSERSSTARLKDGTMKVINYSDDVRELRRWLFNHLERTHRHSELAYSNVIRRLAQGKGQLTDPVQAFKNRASADKYAAATRHIEEPPFEVPRELESNEETAMYGEITWLPPGEVLELSDDEDDDAKVDTFSPPAQSDVQRADDVGLAVEEPSRSPSASPADVGSPSVEEAFEKNAGKQRALTSTLEPQQDGSPRNKGKRPPTPTSNSPELDPAEEADREDNIRALPPRGSGKKVIRKEDLKQSSRKNPTRSPSINSPIVLPPYRSYFATEQAEAAFLDDSTEAEDKPAASRPRPAHSTSGTPTSQLDLNNRPTPPNPETLLHDHFYRTPLPIPLNRHNKSEYDYTVDSVKLGSQDFSLLDLYFKNRRSVKLNGRPAEVTIVGTAKPHGDTGASRRRSEEETKGLAKKVTILGGDIVRLEAGIEHLVLETKLARFVLHLPNSSSATSVMFDDSNNFLVLLRIGSENQIIGLGNDPPARPSERTTVDLVKEFSSIKPPLPQNLYLALQDLDNNPIAIILTLSLRSPTYDEEAYLRRVTEEVKSHLRVKDQHQHGEKPSRPVRQDGGCSAPSEALFDRKIPRDIVTYKTLQVNGERINSGDYILIAGQNNSEDTKTKFGSARTKGRGGKRKKAKPSRSDFEFIGDEYADDEEDEERDEERRRLERPNEPWVALVVYFESIGVTTKGKKSTEYSVHVNWCEKARDGPIGARASPLHIFPLASTRGSKTCETVNVGCIVRKIEVQRLQHGMTSPDRVGFYSSLWYKVDNGECIDADLFERKPIANASLFLERGVAECAGCDRQISANLESIATPIETPFEIRQSSLSNSFSSDYIMGLKAHVPFPDTNRLCAFHLEGMGLDSCDFRKRNPAKPDSSVALAGVDYHIGDLVYVNTEDPATGPLRLARLAAVCSQESQLPPQEGEPYTIEYVHLHWVFRRDSLLSDSEMKDEREVVLSSIGEDVWPEVLHGKAFLSHTSTFNHELSKDHPHRFHTRCELPHYLPDSTDEEKDKRAKAIIDLFKGLKTGEINKSTRDGLRRKNALDLLPVSEEDIAICPSCAVAEQSKDDKQERLKAQIKSGKIRQGSVTETYAGVGGLAKGMMDGCLFGRLDLAIEKNVDAAQALGANLVSSNVVVQATCEAVLEHPQRFIKKQMEPLIVSGGPPCQGFSTCNLFPSTMDPRIFEPFVLVSKIVELLPPIALFENGKRPPLTPLCLADWSFAVRAITTFAMPGDTSDGPLRGGLVGLMIDILHHHGQVKGSLEAVPSLADVARRFRYQTRVALMNAAQYGSPQNRRRFFILAALRGLPLPEFPQPTHVADGNYLELSVTFRGDDTRSFSTISQYANGVAPHPAVTVEDAFSDLQGFGFKNPSNSAEESDRRVLSKSEGYEAQPWKRSEPLGFEGLSLYPGEPRTTFQRIARENCKNSVGSHFTPGYAKEVYPHRLTSITKNYEDIDSDSQDDSGNVIKPALPLHVQKAVEADPNSARAKKLKAFFWARLKPTDILTPLRTSNNIDGSHGPRIHYSDDRVLSYRELARAQGKSSSPSLCQRLLTCGTGFPDNWGFRYLDKTPLRNIEKLIGNAVPVMLARAIAREIHLVFADEVEKHGSLNRLYELSASFREANKKYYPPSPFEAVIAGLGDRDIEREPAMSVVEESGVDSDGQETSIVADSEEEMEGVGMEVDEKPEVYSFSSEDEESRMSVDGKEEQRAGPAAPIELIIISDSDSDSDSD
ncbi:hypothetical protein P7C70_g1223, partial [Phenoliferia sp. Uapishka_3]